MKTLTKRQEVAVKELKQTFIDGNKEIFFDLENSISIGLNNKQELAKLKKRNDATIVEIKEKCLFEFNKLQDFLGEYKNCLILNDLNLNDNIGFSFKSSFGSINFHYQYTYDHFEENDDYEIIGDVRHEIYVGGSVEVWGDILNETVFESTALACFSVSSNLVQQVEFVVERFVQECID